MKVTARVGPWVTRENLDLLLEDLETYDLIEIRRAKGVYCHWGMFLGIRTVENEHGLAVIHRNSDGESAVSGLFSASNGKQKGAVTISLLKDVLENDKCRVNNTLDGKIPISTPREIRDKMSKALMDQEVEVGQYNVIKNNCEHFVAWLRYDFKHSMQVYKAVKKIIVTGSCAAGTVLSGAVRAVEVTAEVVPVSKADLVGSVASAAARGLGKLAVRAFPRLAAAGGTAGAGAAATAGTGIATSTLVIAGCAVAGTVVVGAGLAYLGYRHHKKNKRKRLYRVQSEEMLYVAGSDEVLHKVKK